MNTKRTNQIAPMRLDQWLAELHAAEAASWETTPKPRASIGGRKRTNVYGAALVKVIVHSARRTEIRFVVG